MRAAVYLRQSLDRTGNMLAISRQRGPCLDLCAQRGWEVTEYVDNDKSATRGRRPSYQKMLADIEAGKIDAVVVWDLDRLYRRPVELEHLIQLADSRRLLLATITGDADLSTDNGRLYARIKGAVARSEVERKSARQKASHIQRVEAGIPWGNRRTFGYTDDMQPHPTEAKAVREAYASFLAGSSLGSIATTWTEAGFTTTLGNPWKGPGVSRLLSNPRLAGRIAYHGEDMGEGKWPAIVDYETWQAARAVMADPRRNPRPGSRARKYLLTGIALCGKCTEPVKLTSGITARSKAIYRCPVCHGIGRDQAALDDHILEVAAIRCARKDAAELLVDHGREDIGELVAESAELNGKLDAAAADYAEGLITRSQLRTASERLRAKIRAIDTRMADAERSRIFEGIVGAPDTRAAIEAAGLDRQREIVSTLMTITVRPTVRGARFHPESVDIDWNPVASEGLTDQ